MSLTCKARVLFYRGDLDGAAAISADLLPGAREVGDAQVLVPALSVAALTEADPHAAVALVEEALAAGYALYPDTARVCVRNGELAVAQRMAEVDSWRRREYEHIAATVQAMLAEARGEREETGRLYAEAVRRWTEHPFVLERGLCLLGRSARDGRRCSDPRSRRDLPLAGSSRSRKRGGGVGRVLWLGGMSGVGKRRAARDVARRHDLWLYSIDARTYAHAEAMDSPSLRMTLDELWLERRLRTCAR